VLWLGALVNKLGAFIAPFLAIYLTSVRGMSLATAGIVVALYGAGTLGSSLVGGALSDRIGRKRTLVGATVLGAAAMLHMGVARSPVHIAIAAALLGLFGNMYRPALHTATADLVPPERRARAYGYLHWAANLGFAFATIIGGLVAGASYTLLFVIDAATTLALGALVLAYVPETRPAPLGDADASRPDLLTPYRDGVFAAFISLALVVTTVFLQYNVTLPLHMTRSGMSPREYGLLIATNGIVIVLAQPFVIRIVERTRPMLSMALGAICVGVGFGMTALVTTPAGYAASIVVWTLGEMAIAPISSTVVSMLAPRDLRGSYQGAMGVAFGGAELFAPIVGTTLLGATGSTGLWSLCFVTGVSTAIGFLLLGRAQAFNRNAAPSPAAISSGVMRPSLSMSSASNTASVPDHSSRVM
jgi:MFS family permease